MPQTPKMTLGKEMRYLLLVLVSMSLLLGGCGTINAERESYMKDSVYEKRRYFGDAVSSPEFSRYEMGLGYEVSDGKLLVRIDPQEIYTQSKELFVVKNAVSYERYGPIRYSPPTCIFSVVTVFNVLFAMIDDNYAESLKKSCYKVYEWDKREKELPPESAGIKTVELVKRDYRDADGRITFFLEADGKRVNQTNLTGFRESNRSGSYEWVVNNWFDFSRLNQGDDLDVIIANQRNKENFILLKKVSISDEDSENLIFQHKFDAVVSFMAACEYCNYQLKALSRLEVAEFDHLGVDYYYYAWKSDRYFVKGRNGEKVDSLDIGRIASCLNERFSYGAARVKDFFGKTESGHRSDFRLIEDIYEPERSKMRTPGPDIDDIRHCASAEYVNADFYYAD